MFSKPIAILAILTLTGVQASPAPVAQPDTAAASSSKLPVATFVHHRPDTPQRSGGYINSCSGMYLDGNSSEGWYMRGICNNKGGAPERAVIKIGSCVGNNNGQLVYLFNGSFGNSCNNVDLKNGQYLYASCLTKSGSRVNSNFDLNSAIGNSNGILVC